MYRDIPGLKEVNDENLENETVRKYFRQQMVIIMVILENDQVVKEGSQGFQKEEMISCNYDLIITIPPSNLPPLIYYTY